MSYAHSVQVGPEFFRKAFRDYSDKFWAFAREILQNGMDCGSRNIHIKVVEHDALDETIVVVENDGEPMDRDTLTGKLLSLGSSGKDFRDGAVGGFGKAKEILYFAHKQYFIVSGGWHVAGRGGGYDLSPWDVPLLGTRSRVVWDGLVGARLRSAFRRFVELAGRRKGLTFTLDGEELAVCLPCNKLHRALEHEGQPWGEVWSNGNRRDLLVVRIGGVPMYTEDIRHKAAIILELKGTSGERLTANRDGLLWHHGKQVRDFVATLQVDKKTALVKQEPDYRHIAGAKLRRQGDAPVPAAVAAALAVAEGRADKGGAGILVVPRSAAEERPRPGRLVHDFVLKSCVRRWRVPAAFDPADDAFSAHAAWLVRAWAGCLLELHELAAVDHDFSVGFVFSEETAAESECARYGQTYLLNPCRPGKRGWVRRFTRADRGAIVALAAHEFVHGALNESVHDEDYARKLTETFGLVGRHWRRFARHFR